MAHHAAGLRRALAGSRDGLADGLSLGRQAALSTREAAIVAYVEILTREPATLQVCHAAALRQAGLDDLAIHDLVQVAAYFAYVNRIVLGLGVELEQDHDLGQQPRD